MRRTRWFATGVVATALAAVAATSTAAAPAGLDRVAKGISCSAPKIGIIEPLTGPAATVGQEIKNWMRFSVSQFNAAHHTHFSLVETDDQLDPAQSSVRAQQLASNSAVAAILGPAGSQGVLSAGPILKRAGVAFISASATNTTLTNGQFGIFFSRVVPNDSIQGPTTARFIRLRLKPKNVVIIDDQEAYSTGLAASVQANLAANNINVTRKSVSQDETDFSSLVTSLPSDTDVVYLPWQIAANALLFVQELRAQGKFRPAMRALAAKVKVVGSDGLSSSDFNKPSAAGAYVFSFAPDIVHAVPADAALIRQYNAKYGKDWGTFGPPAYLSAQVAMLGIMHACANGKTTRLEVAQQIRKVDFTPSILGGRCAFDKKGDALPTKFYVAQLNKQGKPIGLAF